MFSHFKKVSFLSLLAAVTVLSGCNSEPVRPSSVQLGQITTEDLYIVDCLLPGQVRQLGTGMTYLAPRRAIKTSAHQCALRGGEYVAYDRANYATALKIWLPAAQQGDAEAQVYVGEIYEDGMGSQPDFSRASNWYQKAAAQGNSRAMINLGHLYEQGKGVAKDPVKALNLYRKAAGIKKGELELTTEEERALRLSQAVENDKLKSKVLALTDQLKLNQSALGKRQKQLAQVQRELINTQNKLRTLSDAKSQARKDARAELLSLERDIRRKTEQIERYQQTAKTLMTQLGVSPVKAGTRQASIDIIAPDVVVMRGVPSATVFPDVTEYDVIGRVSDPADLMTFTVNDKDARSMLDPSGIFEYPVYINSGSTNVSINMITKDGQKISQQFLIERQKAQPLKPRPASKFLRQRMRSDTGTTYALVIGNNDYQHFLPLNTAVNDAKSIGALFKNRYGYQTQVLENATLDQIVSSIASYTQKIKSDDDLIIYFAGHGVIDEKTGMGYWIPTDGHSRERSQWLSNERITDFISAMQARHVLVVADSCYSGTLSGTAIRPLPNDAADDDLVFISRVRARTVLTSGGLQPVSDQQNGGDHSLFAEAFINALQNNSNVLEGYRLFEYVQEQVRRSASLSKLRQIPEYSALRHAGHEGSEFFFMPLEKKLTYLPNQKQYIATN
ncbi:MAG: caspase family protein [bacterium]